MKINMLLLLIKLFSQEKKIKGKFQFRDTTTAQFSKHQKSFPTLVVWKHSNLRAQRGRGRTDRMQDMSSTANSQPNSNPNPPTPSNPCIPRGGINWGQKAQMLQFYIVVKTFFAAISLDYEVVTLLTLPGLFIFPIYLNLKTGKNSSSYYDKISCSIPLRISFLLTELLHIKGKSQCYLYIPLLGDWF